MKFLVLMAEEDHFDRWNTATEAERDRFFEGLRAFTEAVAERGKVLAGEALAPPEDAVTLRAGRPPTTGPYAETAEQVGGFYLVELPDLGTAVEAAGLLPDSVSVEVRPVLDVG